MESHKSEAKEFVHSLTEGVYKSSDVLYYMIFSFYLLSLLLSRVAWDSETGISGNNLKLILTVLVLLFTGIYLASVLVLLVRKKWAMFAIVPGVTALLFLCARMQRDQFDGLMIVLLILFSYGRSYKRILQISFLCTAVTVIMAALGVLIGFTKEMPKTGAYGTGLAFGIIHPNVWGTYVFLLLVLAWYLFVLGKSRYIQYGYYIFSWLLGIFMVIVPKCRTEALLALAFPAITVACQWLLIKPHVTKKRRIKSFLIWILILTPVVCFALTVILGELREWLVVHTFGTYIENFSKRFIQSGLAFKLHGFPLFGELLQYNTGYSEQLGDYKAVLYVMDNAYSSYGIMRGMIWLIPILLWLCHANRRAVKERDYSLLAISVLLSLLSLMERRGLDVHNFVFFYPLAKSVWGQKCDG